MKKAEKPSKIKGFRLKLTTVGSDPIKRCFKNELKMVYSPELQIEHYRNVSTNSDFDKNTDKKKLDFFYKQTVKSLSLLLKMVKE